jgi:hypothetical protein
VCNPLHQLCTPARSADCNLIRAIYCLSGCHRWPIVGRTSRAGLTIRVSSVFDPVAHEA